MGRLSLAFWLTFWCGERGSPDLKGSVNNTNTVLGYAVSLCSVVGDAAAGGSRIQAEARKGLRTLRTVNMSRERAVKISFTGVEQREFEPLPTGRQLSKLSSAEYVPQSARSGEPAVAWQFTVDGGEYDGRKAFLNTSLQVQSLWSTQRVLLALGMTKEEIDALDWDTNDPESVQTTLDELVKDEQPCVIVIGHEMFEGTKRQRVRRVLSAEGVEAAEEKPF